MTTTARDPRQMSLELPCRHRWLVASPNGTATVAAKCTYCGASRDFKVTLDQEFHPKSPGRGRAVRL